MPCDVSRNRMKKLGGFFAGILAGSFILSLAGCSSGSAISDVSGAESTTAPNETATGAPPITHVTLQDNPSTISAGPEGIYLLQSVFPASASLFYIDSSTNQEIYLCSSPNCSHNTDACTSYFPLQEWEYGYNIFYYNEVVYLVQGAAGPESPPHLIKINRDGTGRQTFCTLNDGESFTGFFFGYGDSLLAELSITDEAGTTRLQMEKIGCADGSRETLVVYPAGQYNTLMSAADGKLIYIGIDEGDDGGNSGFQYYWVDPGADDISLEACRENAPLTEVFDNTTVSYSIQGDYLCKTDRVNNLLSARHLENGDSFEIPIPAPDDGSQVMGLVHLFDDQFALEIDPADGGIVLQILDRATGEGTGVSYTPAKMHPMQIIAAYDDEVIYRTETVERPLPMQAEYGLAGETCYVDLFAFVTKTDYLNGVAGTEIESPV